MTDDQMAAAVESALAPRRHVWYECPQPCASPAACAWCDGGLSACTVCKCMEGSLTSECPGFDCYDKFGDDIYAGKIDFRSGQWVNLPSKFSPKNDGWE